MGPLIVALTPKGRPKPSAEQIKTIDTLLRSTNDVKALAAVLRGLARKELAISDDQVKGIKVPMTALIGEVDPLRAGVDALKKLRPDLPVVVIDKADHISAFSRPEFVDGVKQILDRQHAKKK
jgi:hypothetical protein